MRLPAWLCQRLPIVNLGSHIGHGSVDAPPIGGPPSKLAPVEPAGVFHAKPGARRGMNAIPDRAYGTETQRRYSQ